MKGQILDVYPEGESSFRACVIELINGDEGLVKVVNLETGEITERHLWECEDPIINNIFIFD